MDLIENFLLYEFLEKPVWMWLIFLVVVGFLLALDLGLLHRKQHEIGIKESLLMSAFYISMGFAFGGWIWWFQGQEKSLEYLTVFVVEKSLSMDNIFVIALIFSYFAIPRMYQHRTLFYGIIGVLILRALMIAAGAALLSKFEWILLVFAAFLVFAGIKLLFMGDEEPDISQNPTLRFLRRHFRTTDRLYGQRFFIYLPSAKRDMDVLYMTPLFVALVMIEIADVIFAVDSVPANFAITRDPYIIYTSSVFAILGLRALFFALSAIIERFKYVKYALAAVLVFIGGKVLVIEFFHLEKFPPSLSLAITLSMLAMGFFYSIWKTRETGEKEA
jgi:tellurite resistance protein TerC